MIDRGSTVRSDYRSRATPMTVESYATSPCSYRKNDSLRVPLLASPQIDVTITRKSQLQFRRKPVATSPAFPTKFLSHSFSDNRRYLNHASLHREPRPLNSRVQVRSLRPYSVEPQHYPTHSTLPSIRQLMEIRKNKFYQEACSKRAETQSYAAAQCEEPIHSRNQIRNLSSVSHSGQQRESFESKYLGNYKTSSNLPTKEESRAESAQAANEREIKRYLREVPSLGFLRKIRPRRETQEAVSNFKRLYNLREREAAREEAARRTLKSTRKKATGYNSCEGFLERVEKAMVASTEENKQKFESRLRLLVKAQKEQSQSSSRLKKCLSVKGLKQVN